MIHQSMITLSCYNDKNQNNGKNTINRWYTLTGQSKINIFLGFVVFQETEAPVALVTFTCTPPVRG